MKVNVIGVSRRVGISAKNGQPYDIAEVAYLIEDKDGEKNGPDGNRLWVYKAHGYRVGTLELQPEALPRFKDQNFPAEIDLAIEPKPDAPSRNWVTGIAA